MKKMISKKRFFELTVFVIISVVFFLFANIANAKTIEVSKSENEVADSKIKGEITTDKSSYISGEDAVIKASVTNESSNILLNANLNLHLPKFFENVSVVTESTNDNTDIEGDTGFDIFKGHLAPGEKVLLTINAKVKNNTPVKDGAVEVPKADNKSETVVKTKNRVSTGDRSNTNMWIVLVIASFVLFIFAVRKKGRAGKVLSALLVLSLMLSGGNIRVRALEIGGDRSDTGNRFTLIKSVNVDSLSQDIVLSYGYEKEEEHDIISTGYEITGRIYAKGHQDSTPVPEGAKVELLRGEDVVANNVGIPIATDVGSYTNDGYYHIRGVKGGETYRLRVTNDAYITQISDEFTITDSDINKDFIMQRGKFIWKLKKGTRDFDIPMSQPGRKGTYNLPYDVSVLVNDKVFGTYKGTSSPTSRISLRGIEDENENNGPKIEIRPNDLETWAWGKAIGYNGVKAVGAEFVGQDALVELDVVLTKTMLLEGGNVYRNVIGNNFDMYKYYNCKNLKNGESLGGFADVKEIEDNFQVGKYQNCESLIQDHGIKVFSQVKKIGDNFEAYKYAGCKSLDYVEELEILSPEIEDLGNGFCRGKYKDCILLDEVENINVLNNTINIGDYFEAEKYMGCTSLTKVEDMNPIADTETLGDYFESYKYANCTSLNEVEGADSVAKISKIGDNFTEFKYMNCTSLKKIEQVNIFKNITEPENLGDDFGRGKYFNCINIENKSINEVEYDDNLINVLKAENWEKLGDYMFYVQKVDGSYDNVPGNTSNGGLPLNMNGESLISSSGTGIKEYCTGRTKIYFVNDEDNTVYTYSDYADMGWCSDPPRDILPFGVDTEVTISPIAVSYM